MCYSLATTGAAARLIASCGHTPDATTGGRRAGGGGAGNTVADDIDVEAPNILLVAIRNGSGGEDSGATLTSEPYGLLSTWPMVARAVFAWVLSCEPAASTTGEILELTFPFGDSDDLLDAVYFSSPRPITIPDDWNLVDARETLSASSDVVPGITDPDRGLGGGAE
ncbi:unnamed protein product [Ectocarpus fasciculatus]